MKQMTLCGMLLSVSIALLSMPGYSDSSNNLLRLCMVDWPPGATPLMKNKGFNMEMAKAVLEDAGFAISLDFLPWNRCVKEVARHAEYDLTPGGYLKGVASFHAQGVEFVKGITFSTDQLHFLANVDSSLKTAADLSKKDLVVGLMKGGGEVERVKKEYKHLKIEYVSSYEQQLQMLKKKRVDVVTVDPLQAQYYITKQNLKFKFRALNPPLSKEPTGMMISQKHPRKKELMDKILVSYKKLCQNGTFAKIMEKSEYSWEIRNCKNKKYIEN